MGSNLPEGAAEENWYHEPEDADWAICPQCDGLGTDNWDEEKLCPRCMGTGEILRLS